MLSAFDFKGNEIRFVDGKPVANDVAKVLGYADPANAVNRIVDTDYKGLVDLQTPSGVQKTYILEEAGIYQLIFKSKLEGAKEFQRWVFQEVLPSIRKTGFYSVQSQPQLPCHEVALLKARTIAEIDDILSHQPRLAQFLIDHTISDLMEQKLLTGQEMRGVVEIAQDLGFPINPNNRCKLGSFVRSQIPHLGKQEKRLVNGQMRLVWCYHDNDEVRNVVAKYFTN